MDRLLSRWHSAITPSDVPRHDFHYYFLHIYGPRRAGRPGTKMYGSTGTSTTERPALGPQRYSHIINYNIHRKKCLIWAISMVIIWSMNNVMWMRFIVLFQCALLLWVCITLSSSVNLPPHWHCKAFNIIACGKKNHQLQSRRHNLLPWQNEWHLIYCQPQTDNDCLRVWYLSTICRFIVL